MLKEQGRLSMPYGFGRGWAVCLQPPILGGGVMWASRTLADDAKGRSSVGIESFD